MAVSRTVLRKYMGMVVAATTVVGLTAGCGGPNPSANLSVPSKTVSVAPLNPQNVLFPSNDPHVTNTVASATVHSFVAVASARPQSSAIKVPILEYHDITYIPNDLWAMTAQQFTEEMQYLSENKFHSVTLDQFYAAKYRGAKLPSRPVILTFDDGYESNYTNAFPVLQKYGFHATIFMISSFIGRKGFMTQQELTDMQSSGLVQVESHTVDHKNLSKLTQVQVMAEVVKSKQVLTAVMHHPVLYFCYPDGGYNWTSTAAVRRAGYLLATSTDQGYASLSDNPYTLKRIVIHAGFPLSKVAQLLAPSFKSSHA